MSFAQDLRASVLQAAMQGKLTEQLETDTPVSELLKTIEIATQSNKSSKTKKIEQDDFEDDKFFETLPSHWAYVPLKNVANVLYGFPFNSQMFNEENKGTPLIRIRDILPGKTKTYTTETVNTDYIIRKGDMLVGMDGNFNVNYWQSENAALNQRVCKIVTNSEVMIQRYLFYFLPLALEEISNSVSYCTVKHLSDKHLTKLHIPLPPIEEQKRIVRRIEEIMKHIDELEAIEEELKKLKEAFPADMKAAVLQAAMQGKLTEQLETDSSVDDLLEDIKQEREKLVKEGKIKKPKTQNNNFVQLKDGEEPFEIPDNWRWTLSSTILDIRDGTHDTPQYVRSGIPLITSKNLLDDKIDFQNVKYISVDDAKSINVRSKVDTDDILMGMIGTIGKPVLVQNSEKEFSIKNVALFKNFPNKLLNMKYILYFLKTIEPTLNKESTGGVQKFVSLNYLRELLVPLPPLEEQNRIVAKLEQILPLIADLF